MTEKPLPERQNDKEEGNERSPMQKFEGLAKRLLRVDPQKVRDEQERYNEERGSETRRGALKAPG